MVVAVISVFRQLACLWDGGPANRLYAVRAARFGVARYTKCDTAAHACCTVFLTVMMGSTVRLFGTCGGPLHDRGYGIDVPGAKRTWMLQRNSFGKP